MEKRPDLRKRNFTDYMFELTPDIAQDFRITLAADQDVSMFLRSFSNIDGVFNPVSDVEN